MISTLLFLALQVGPPALPPGRPGFDNSADWRVLDGVVTIVNNDIITYRQLDRAMRLARETEEVTTREQLREVQERVRRDAIRRQLRSQAGRELDGVDPAGLDANVGRYLDTRRKELGLAGYVNFLEAQGKDAQSAFSETRKEVFEDNWQRSVRGVESGPRPTRDRFVRPGELRYYYSSNRELYAEPTSVKLQQLLVSDDQAVALEKGSAQEFAIELHERIQAGEDMGILVRQYSPPPPSDDPSAPGALGVLEVNTRNIAIEEIRNFAELAQINALSDPMPLFIPGQDQGPPSVWGIFKLVSRTEGGPAKAFDELGVQSDLKRRVLYQRDAFLVSEGENNLLRKAYIAEPFLAAAEDQ